MKRTILPLYAIALWIAISGTSFAQGRHDERPHGSAKPSAEAVTRAPVTTGRHDEGPYAHSPRKATEKKPEVESGAQAKQSTDADACCSK